MAFSCIENACQRFLNSTLNNITLHTRGLLNRPKQKYPSWHIRKQRVIHDDFITPENRDFIKEVIKDRQDIVLSMQKLNINSQSPLQAEPETNVAWTPNSRRTGVIARKIGDYPLWDKNGHRILTSLLQISDNFVIRYTPPEEYEAMNKKVTRIHRKLGCLLVGSDIADPSLLTKDYCGIFDKTGVLPTKHICRFFISPSAVLSPGTPLYATHFRVGDAVDIRGKTIDRGFQGVMKRWGFKGMPASHGVTKTHRRPGNIGGGGEKARVWPGKKMPGHMGNRWRTARGVKILRINTKYNVIWVEGVAIPGGTNDLCYIFDSILPLRRHKVAPPYPTYFPIGTEEEDIFHESVHPFSDPTITFSE